MVEYHPQNSGKATFRDDVEREIEKRLNFAWYQGNDHDDLEDVALITQMGSV